jgi:hypothetical protein
MKKSFIIVLFVIMLTVVSTACGLDKDDTGQNVPELENSAVAPTDEAPRIFYLENASEKDKLERLLSVTWYADGKIEFAVPPIGSIELKMERCRL